MGKARRKRYRGSNSNYMVIEEEKSAIIKNGIVENILNGNYIKISLMYKNEPDTLVLPCQRYDISIGDTFNNGVFYHNNIAVRYLPTIEERLGTLEEKFRQLIDYLEMRDTER